MQKENNLIRTSVKDIDIILGEEFKVGSDGWIRVIDYMGSDTSIVRAARVSYGEGTRHVSKDRDLIRYLMRHKHTSPFEMCEIVLHLRLPIDVMRQLVRHRTASINEYSTRYSKAIDSMASIEPNAWRTQSTVNNQGSGECLPVNIGEHLSAAEFQLQHQARLTYNNCLAQGVSRELARSSLPLSTYTEAYWKCDLRNLLHFLALRMDSRAQQEIRDYANVIGYEIVRKWVPLSWEAFLDYEFNAITISDRCKKIIALVTSGKTLEAKHSAEFMGVISIDTDGIVKVKREGQEIATILTELGLKVPW